MVISGMFFKVTAAPFHMWAPDVYQGAPTIVTAFFAIVPKAASILFLAKLLLQLFSAWYFDLRQIILFASGLSMIIGAVGAINQQNIKRLIGYSGINHVGFMLMALASGAVYGGSAVIIYIFLYMFMNAGIFAVMLMIKNGENLNNLKGLAAKDPLLAFIMACMMLSMAGIPPLAGFFAKFYVLNAAINARLYIIAIIAIISSVIATYYYLKIIKHMYFDKQEAEIILIKSPSCKVVGLIALLVNVLFIIFADQLIEFSTNAVAVFLVAK